MAGVLGKRNFVPTHLANVNIAAENLNKEIKSSFIIQSGMGDTQFHYIKNAMTKNKKAMLKNNNPLRSLSAGTAINRIIEQSILPTS